MPAKQSDSESRFQRSCRGGHESWGAAQVRHGESVLWRLAVECGALGAKHIYSAALLLRGLLFKAEGNGSPVSYQL